MSVPFSSIRQLSLQVSDALSAETETVSEAQSRKAPASIASAPIAAPKVMLAMVGCGEYASVQEAAKAIVRVKETVLPVPSVAAAYEHKYRRFTRFYPALKGLF